MTTFNTDGKEVLKYEEKRMLELEQKIKDIEKIEQFNEFYMSFYGGIGKKRFTLPWRINNWEVAFKLNLYEVDAQLNKLKDDVEQKKKINKQKKKLESKLAKLMEYNQNEFWNCKNNYEMIKRYNGLKDDDKKV